MGYERNTKRRSQQEAAQWCVVANGTNAEVKAIKAAEAGKYHYVKAFEVVILGAAAVNDILIKLETDDAIFWYTAIGGGAPKGDRKGLVFNEPLRFPVGKAVWLTVAAGGASVVAYASIFGGTSS